MTTKRGSTLVVSLFVAFVLSMLVGTAAVMATGNYSLAWAKHDEEAALQLAEAGINEEMRFITTNMLYAASSTGHPPQTLNGEPYMGQPGTINGIPGKYWVYASEPGKKEKPWDGTGRVQITCTAIVGRNVLPGVPQSQWGRTTHKTISVQCDPISVFSLFALFALDSSNNNQSPGIGLTGSSYVHVVGNVGTNGRIQSGDGDITYDRAYNFNTAYPHPGGSEQFQHEPLYTHTAPMVMPTVTEVLRAAVPDNAKNDPWGWIAKNNTNDQVRQFVPLVGSLTSGGTSRVGFRKDQFILTNSRNDDSGLMVSSAGRLLGASLGSWSAVSLRPGSLTVRSLIFPPGDYYFNQMTLAAMENTEIIIDNGGLTTAQGKNTTGQPVRFWITGTTPNRDTIAIRARMTDYENAGTFRIYYNKDGCVMHIGRYPDSPAKEPALVGGIYAVVNRLNPATLQPAIPGLKGTEIEVEGDRENSGKMLLIKGALFADRVSFHGYCRIEWPGMEVPALDSDPLGGLAIASDCGDDPCYTGAQ